MPEVKERKFELGQVVMTPGAQEALAANLPAKQRKAWETFDELTRNLVGGMMAGQYLRLHQSGDWGSVCTEDAQENERSLLAGDRLMSVYELPAAQRIWVITEWDRSVTTVLLPQDY